MKHPSFLRASIFACVGIIAASAQVVAPHWSVRAAKDDFTDESYIMIAPATELPTNSAKPADAPITDDERFAALDEQFGAETARTMKMKQILKTQPTAFDQIVRLKRMQGRSNTISETQNDLSYFLRPFVAIDNGTLVVGVTVEGKIPTAVDGHKIELHSVLPVGDVQWRIDQNAPVDIDPGKNPPLHLPGATEAVKSPPPPSIPSADTFPPAIEQIAVVQMSKQSAYAAVIGDAASLMLDQMLAGQTLKVRRKPDPVYAQVGATFSAVKIFPLGAEFKILIDQVGLRKNATTGKWELDPAKEKDRASLLKPST